jgi:hypothetical protein
METVLEECVRVGRRRIVENRRIILMLDMNLYDVST